MKHSKFDALVKKALRTVQTKLKVKGDEYAPKCACKDRLAFFKDSGTRQKITALKALRGMWDKHIGSLYDFIERASNEEYIPDELWEEKVTDSMAYEILMLALATEEDEDDF